ncbi:hypothetical protein [Anaeromicropila herbilytica]|uniref:Uncharacterized protein n=1 Tax=Anaeromicropila herbilytica TaxID=2785025 RepID=A0A7R7EJL5_9FIRM|nr:hypothetical protein [Anaeromicropila herbilytica]BCN29985.1 hypothetical protein bsdtb5_12800 [Anaeromicropila herbilytica]
MDISQKINISADTFKGLQDELAKMINQVFEELSTKEYQDWFVYFIEQNNGSIKVKEYLAENTRLSDKEYHNIRVMFDLPEFVDKLSTDQRIPNGSWRINEVMNYNIKILDNYYNLVVQKKDSVNEVIIQSIKSAPICVSIPFNSYDT